MKELNIKLLKGYMDNLQPSNSTRKTFLNTKVLRRIFERLLPEVLVWSLAICIFHEVFIRVQRLLINSGTNLP